MTDKRVLMAQIGAAHGIRGEVRVKPFTDDPLALADYGPLAPEDGGAALVIERLREQATVLVVKFRGIDDRNAAERLNGTRLFVARDALPEPEDDEFYHTDLVGLTARDKAGVAFGEILAVVNFGAGDLLEIQPATGQSVYLPFTKACVPSVDIQAGLVVIEPPDGLFGDDDEAAPVKKPTRAPKLKRPDAAEAEAKAETDVAAADLDAERAP